MDVLLLYNFAGAEMGVVVHLLANASYRAMQH